MYYTHINRDALIQKLDELLDSAVWEGRSNWDGYYGHNNDYHMSTIKESEEYKKFLTFPENLL